jgi:CO/xanthine dehydrogenase FAD-binding subunit
MTPYAYHRPTSLKELLHWKATTPDAQFIAGGTDLLLKMRRGTWKPTSALLSLRAVPELVTIDVGDGLRIGGAVPVIDIARHPTVAAWYPALAQALASLGSRQVQNVATVGGNLCRASPCADSAPPLLVYGARVELQSAHATRQVLLSEFFRGPGRTLRAEDEVLTAIVLPRPDPGARAVFQRRSRVRMDLSTASLAVLLVFERGVCTKARVAAGSVGPIPMRLTDTEAIFEGSDLGPATLARAHAQALKDVLPITDVRSTAEYRRHMIGVFLNRALRQLTALAGRDGGS